MEHEPKGRGARSAGDRQRRPVQAGVTGRTGPDRRDRQEVCQIESRDQGPAHVGVGFARQGAQPGLHGVEVLDPRRQSLGVERRLDGAGLGRRPRLCRIQDRHRQGEVAEGAGLGAEHLQGAVALFRLGGGVGVDQGLLLAGNRLPQQGPYALSLGKPALAQPDDLPLGLRLVETDPARGPAIGEGQGPQPIQQAGPGRRRQAPHGHGPEPLIAEPGRRPTRQTGVGQPDVEKDRRIRRLHRMGFGRDAGVQPGQKGLVLQRGDFRQGVRQEIKGRIRLAPEARQGLAPALPGPGKPVEQPSLEPPRLIGRRQPGQGQPIVCFKGRLCGLEPVPSLGVDQPGRLRLELALGIGGWRLSISAMPILRAAIFGTPCWTTAACATAIWSTPASTTPT
ncbi:hypothetical protein D3C72_585410 [compost metagenome]